MAVAITPLSQVIAQTATTSSTWSVTGATVNYTYRLNVSSGATTGAAGNTIVAADTSFTLPAVTAATKLPAIGTVGTATYRLQEQPPAGSFTDTAITNITVRRAASAPTTSATQNFNTTTTSNTFTHAIVYSIGAAPSGTINFAVSETASTYATVTTWTTINSFTLTRGVTYYFWTRSDTAAVASSVQQLTVPFVPGVPDTTIAITAIPTIPLTYNTSGYNVSVSAAGTVGTKYQIYKGGIASNSVRDGPGTLSLENGPSVGQAGTLPEWGGSNFAFADDEGDFYQVYAYLDSALGYNPTKILCTTTTGTALSWTMWRDAPPPTLTNVSITGGTTTATATINASKPYGLGTLYYSINGVNYQTSNVFTITRQASQTFYVYTKGLAINKNIDSDVVTTTLSTLPDTTPDAFPFASVTGAALSTVQTSGTTVTVTGVDTSVAISVSGGTTPQYRIGTGAYTGVNGSVVSGNTVNVRHTSSAEYGTNTITTVNIGLGSETFTSTTLIPTVTITNSATVITQTATSSVARAVSSAPAGSYCRLYVTAGATIGAVTETVSGPAVAGVALAIPAITTASKLPATGGNTTTTYRLEIASSSTGTYVNTGLTITVRRLAGAPTVAPNQNFSTAAGTPISHAIVLSNTGIGGTLNYAVSTTASTYATVTTWTPTNSFSLVRGTAYYFWARTDTNASSASVVQATVPATGSIATVKNIGSITLNPATDLVGSSISNVIITTSASTASQDYRIVRTDFTTDIYPATAIYPPTFTLTYSSNIASTDYNDLPLRGVTATYGIQVARYTGNNGDNIFYDATLTDGSPATFTITRISPPTIVEPQPFNTSLNATTINHAIDLGAEGVGGSLSYAATTTATYPTTWSTTNNFVLTRGTSYYLWARRSADALDYGRSSTALLVPNYSSSNYGLRVWDSTGAKIVFDTDFFPTNYIPCKVGASTISTYVIPINTFLDVTIAGVTPTNSDSVYVVVNGFVDLVDGPRWTVTRNTGYIRITNLYTLGPTQTVYFFAGRYK